VGGLLERPATGGSLGLKKWRRGRGAKRENADASWECCRRKGVPSFVREEKKPGCTAGCASGKGGRAISVGGGAGDLDLYNREMLTTRVASPGTREKHFSSVEGGLLLGEKGRVERTNLQHRNLHGKPSQNPKKEPLESETEKGAAAVCSTIRHKF